MNVTDSASIARAIDQVVRTYGGFDVFISNAGVLRAESVKTQSENDFDFVTDVNYKGYFLCVKAAAPVLAAQHRANSGLLERHHSDQFEVGTCRLEKELCVRGQQIRRHRAHAVVRAGAGRRWHQGERRLPRQFSRRPAVVRSGKGFVRAVSADRQSARREDDCRRQSTPTKRRCRWAAAARRPTCSRRFCILIEQQYETGQALPVTGGQEMLR